MSTDYDAVCHTCKLTWHIGQRFSVGFSFGYGSDDREGQSKAMERIVDHSEHGTIEVMTSYKADELRGYSWIDDEDGSVHLYESEPSDKLGA